MERIYDKNNIGVAQSMKECYNNTEKQEKCGCSGEDKQRGVYHDPVCSSGSAGFTLQERSSLGDRDESQESQKGLLSGCSLF